MEPIKKEVYIGYVVLQYPGHEERVITPTTCTYESKVMALDAVSYHVRSILEDTNCEIISRGVKKLTIKWQRKSLNH